MARTVVYGDFEWDEEKEEENIKKHGVSFESALNAFLDEYRIIATDEKHSNKEERKFCIGQVEDDVITVRYTLRNKRIRIIGAGSWRKERKIYEEEKKKKTK